MPETAIWTIESVREYLLSRIDERDKRYEQRFDASQKALELGLAAQKSAIDAALAAASTAVTKAELASEKRFDGVNEFRGALTDQQTTLIPRSEVTVMMQSANDKITTLQKQVDAMVSERKGVAGGWGYAVAVIGVVAVVVGIILAFAKH